MIGTSVSHYRIISHIGAGGMGTVYLAEDTNLKRRVALKFLTPDAAASPEAAARLLREARAAAATPGSFRTRRFSVATGTDRIRRHSRHACLNNVCASMGSLASKWPWTRSPASAVPRSPARASA